MVDVLMRLPELPKREADLLGPTHARAPFSYLYDGRRRRRDGFRSVEEPFVLRWCHWWRSIGQRRLEGWWWRGARGRGLHACVASYVAVRRGGAWRAVSPHGRRAGVAAPLLHLPGDRMAAAFAAAPRARNANWMAFLTAGSHNVRARAPTTTIAKCSISHTGRALEPSPHASVKTIPLFTRGEQS